MRDKARRKIESEVPENEDVFDSESAGQAGDTQGLSDIEEADSESVEELAEEGQAEEAEVVDAVENAPDPDVSEVPALAKFPKMTFPRNTWTTAVATLPDCRVAHPGVPQACPERSRRVRLLLANLEQKPKCPSA